MSELTQAIIMLVLVGVSYLSFRNAVACGRRAAFYDAGAHHLMPGEARDELRESAERFHNAARVWNNIALGMAVLIVLFYIVFVT